MEVPVETRLWVSVVEFELRITSVNSINLRVGVYFTKSKIKQYDTLSDQTYSGAYILTRVCFASQSSFVIVLLCYPDYLRIIF